MPTFNPLMLMLYTDVCVRVFVGAVTLCRLCALVLTSSGERVKVHVLAEV